MLPSLKLRLILVCFLGGIVFSQFVTLFWSVLFFCLLIVWCFNKSGTAFLALSFLFFGSAYANFYQSVRFSSNLHTAIGENVILSARVVGESRLSRSGFQTVRLKIEPTVSEGESLKGFLLWQNAPSPKFYAGDRVKLSGTITNINNFTDDFDAKAYWARWGVTHSLIRVQVLERSEPRTVWVHKGREQAIARLNQILSRPHSTIALGMLIGLKEKLPPALEDDFKEAGLQHLLVVSGTNVTLLIFALGLLLKPLSPWLKYSIMLLFLGAYLQLVGFDPPALRATLFGAIIGFALTSGFNVEYRNLLLLCAALMCLVDPNYIIRDVSFWLSFSATAGIFLFVPLLNQGLRFIKFTPLRLLLAASFAAQVSVFPILIITFGTFPYGGLFSNLVTEPLVPLIMLFAAGTILIGGLNLLGLELVWASALELSISTLIGLAQLTVLLPNVFVPVWLGYALVFGLLIVSLWACFSRRYQGQYWEPFERSLQR